MFECSSRATRLPSMTHTRGARRLSRPARADGSRVGNRDALTAVTPCGCHRGAAAPQGAPAGRETLNDDARARRAATPGAPATYRMVHAAADCCRKNGGKVGATGNNEAPSPQHCEALCTQNRACTFFSHSAHWGVCMLCSKCTFTSGKTQGGRYTSWARLVPPPATTTGALVPTTKSGTAPPAATTAATDAPAATTVAAAAATPATPAVTTCDSALDFYTAAGSTKFKSNKNDRLAVVRGRKGAAATPATCAAACAGRADACASFVFEDKKHGVCHLLNPSFGSKSAPAQYVLLACAKARSLANRSWSYLLTL